MIGKASEIMTHFVDDGFVSGLQKQINEFLNSHSSIEIIDIRYQMGVDPLSDNGIYHVAMIIFRVVLP